MPFLSVLLISRYLSFIWSNPFIWSIPGVYGVTQRSKADGFPDEDDQLLFKVFQFSKKTVITVHRHVL